MACDHCGTVSAAIERWPQYVHDNCECLCHRYKSTQGKKEYLDSLKENRKRKKKS